MGSFNIFKKLFFAATLAVLSFNASANGHTIKQIYYCADDFALEMSNGQWYLVQKSMVGEKKLDHFLSMAMFMMATEKKTGSMFPKDPIDWCGNKNMRPINILSIKN